MKLLRTRAKKRSGEIPPEIMEERLKMPEPKVAIKSFN